jgi:hypothetical protein
VTACVSPYPSRRPKHLLSGHARQTGAAIRPTQARGVREIRGDVDRLARVLAHPAAFEGGFGGRDERGAVGVSPCLMFAVVVVHRGWYQLATRTARPLTASMQVVAAVGGSFGEARRTLNYLTDRHLFSRRGDWFGELPA